MDAACLRHVRGALEMVAWLQDNIGLTMFAISLVAIILFIKEL